MVISRGAWATRQANKQWMQRKGARNKPAESTGLAAPYPFFKKYPLISATFKKWNFLPLGFNLWSSLVRSSVQMAKKENHQSANTLSQEAFQSMNIYSKASAYRSYKHLSEKCARITGRQ